MTSHGAGTSLRVPGDLWDQLGQIAQEAGVSRGLVCVAGANLSKTALRRALARCVEARRASAYLSEGRYIWVQGELLSAAKKAAQQENTSFSSFALVLLFVSDGQRARALERSQSALDRQRKIRRAQRLRARATTLLKEAARLETLCSQHQR